MNNDKGNDFLFRHVEKFVFGVLILVGVFLIYSGFQKPNYLDKQQPDRMEQQANQVRTSIDDDHWENIAEPRMPTMDVVARTNASIRPVDPSIYRLSHPWEAKSIDRSIKRQDPVLLAPVEVLATGVVSPIALKTLDAEYALKALENADAVERAPEPQPREERRRPRRGRRGGGYEMEEYEYGSEMEEYDYSDEMSSGMGGEGMGMTAGRRVDSKFDRGFRPQQAANVRPDLGHFIAGVALMPHKKLHEAYDAALKQADGYDARRDQPVYVGYQIQRADVTDKSVDELTDEDWVQRAYTRYIEALVLQEWAGVAKEIVTGKYRDNKLTSHIPPVLLTHYTFFAAHPKIPLGDEETRPGGRTRPEAIVPIGPVTSDLDADPFAAQARVPDAARRGGPGSMRPRMPYGGPGMRTQVVDHPEYKLIRFYDFRDTVGRNDRTAPQPGRKYVYRVRVAVEDPNFPADPASQPRSSTLSAEVFQRVQAETAKAKETNRRMSVRVSDYSEPSPIVSLPPTDSAYAGPVVPPTVRPMQVGGRSIDVVTKPPSGKVVVAPWDKTYKVPVPIFTEVIRGAVISKKGEVEIPDPLSLIVKKLPDADVKTETVVVDMVGGRPLTIHNGENQSEPGMFLLFDPLGGLRVVDEVDTQWDYRMYSFADDRGE